MPTVDDSQVSGTFVLFGITGDLAFKKLFPALYELAVNGIQPRVVGVARSDHSDDSIRARVKESLADYPNVDMAMVDNLADRITYVRGDYGAHETHAKLAEVLADEPIPTFFLAIPPSLFDDVATGLASADLNRGRLIVEKPFGRNLASAMELNEILHRHFAEKSIFRIDHFLGKEAVMNLLVFRFANALMESVWNRHHINRVTITMAESFDISGRGGFYDGVGAIRDVIQNHLLQMVALLAMEPPIDESADALRDEKVKVLRAMRPADPGTVIRGQYRGYLDEPGVPQNSATETFASMKLYIDSWRWSGVPFHIRAGKAMPETLTEAVIEFAAPPTNMFGDHLNQSNPCHLRFRMKPDSAISLTMMAKAPGDKMVSEPVDLSVDYGNVLGASGPDPYERLIGDALEGDARNFARQDGVEASWRIVDPILDLKTGVKQYQRGTWGPDPGVS